ncbi:uncharacterized [Tachysurus ichikawai]
MSPYTSCNLVPKTHVTLMLHLVEQRYSMRMRIELHLHASREHETGDTAIVNNGRWKPENSKETHMDTWRVTWVMIKLQAIEF